MASALFNLALNPVVTGPAYSILGLPSPYFRDPVIAHLSKYIPASILSKSISALGYLFLLGLVRQTSAYLSQLSQNNWRLGSEAHRYDWPKEIAVVTGGTGGFGTLICNSLAAKGLTVICVDISPSMSEEMEANPKIHYHKCDITSPEAVAQLGETVKQTYGHPSILINNAGIGYDHAIINANPVDLNRIYGVNLFSHYYLIQAFMPHMISSKKGHLVSMASMASFVSQAGMADYCGTKAAVLALHEALMQETRVLHGAPEIKFTIVHPTFADTPLYRQYQKKIDAGGTTVIRPEQVSDAVVGQILSGRGGQVVLAAGMEWISSIRGWPQWVQQVLIVASDVGVRRGMAVKEEGK
ncbi:hypothetical protein LTR86_003198 [Recurvomyces mirabilis]|nr:hypothetical protein LTR86_003198 [Recurvomyces mirabilis]